MLPQAPTDSIHKFAAVVGLSAVLAFPYFYLDRYLEADAARRESALFLSMLRNELSLWPSDMLQSLAGLVPHAEDTKADRDAKDRQLEEAAKKIHRLRESQAVTAQRSLEAALRDIAAHRAERFWFWIMLGGVTLGTASAIWGFRGWYRGDRERAVEAPPSS